jgi:hypothetical protein
LWIYIVLIGAIPRVFRFLYPYAWFEDSAYLYHAFAYKSGLKPFIQTLTVHPPTLEYLLAFFYNIFGVSYRIAELLTGIVLFLSALLLFDSACRIFNNFVAIIVMLSFSLSSLLFRYHIFEREVFTLFLSMFIFWMIIKLRKNLYTGILLGFISGIGFGIKFSGIFILFSILGYFLYQRNLRMLFFTIIGFIISTLPIWGYFLLKYKPHSYYQLILFHFHKGLGGNAWQRFLDLFIRDLNFLWILGGSGLALSLFIRNRLLIYPLILFLLYTIFFLFISSTYWPHNMIDLLFPLSLANGISFYYLYNFFKQPKKNIIPLIFISISGIIFISLGNANPRYYNGLGYIKRNEFKQVVDFIQKQTPDKLPIYAPHYIANESHRFKVVDYEELIGPYFMMLKIIEKKSESKDLYKKLDWYELVEKTLPLWRYDLNAMIKQRKVSCVVWDRISPEWSLMYNIDTLLENRYSFFSSAGYRIRFISPNYTVWLLE